ncbi:translation elongation factor Ts [Mucisphaera calidilacus]|uniref:Elongation factor Ts n=1 Tax=Mucisphaera calidilacus TaxID=2527982 RepID=A0A518BTF0_9BACT|nr:translation elongation factor Ts [Mucisphaera calidilacus]QDU70250.1 Elongation factor Ts [Mucisphaera calidilacus]
MAITAKDVMALRKATGLGMMESKAALEEAGGEFDAAVELVRKKGLAKMDTRTDRESAEGRIAIKVSDDKTKAAIAAVHTETDFTANNEDFIKMVEGVADEALKADAGPVEKTDAMQTLIDDVRVTTKENAQFGKAEVLGGAGTRIGSYLHHNGKVGVLIEVDGEASDELLSDLCMHVTAIVPAPLGVNPEDVPQEAIDKEREIAIGQAMESGKPKEIAEKMVEGKMRKYLDTVVLLRQPFVKDDKKQIQDLLPKGSTIKKFVRYQVGG